MVAFGRWRGLLPGFEATSWFALLGGPGIPRDVQMRINAETLKVLALPDVKEKLAKLEAEWKAETGIVDEIRSLREQITKSAAAPITGTQVAVLGTGALGTVVARALAAAGHPTTAWNRTPERLAALVH